MYRVASLWPSPHLHLTQTLQNRSPESTRAGKMEKEKEESERRLNIVKLFLSQFILTSFRGYTFFLCFTLDPLSLKMISTSRILPNCWNEKEEETEQASTSCTASCHGVSALFSHVELARSQLWYSFFFQYLPRLYSMCHISDVPLLKQPSSFYFQL